ncbi:MAG: 3-deoxy-D-manno-octulosonic acid transferase [Steroidobacteraceae bacterium]|nr:3-deoxy-D-manno-octulosonic acid transferase [Deltaproteobacteria bacterium]
MFYLCYNILSIFLLVPVLAYHLYRSISRGRPPALAERFGFIAKDALRKISGRPVIWLHAVSVGEAIAARPLLKALRSQYPGHAILVSNTTETGRGVASGFPEIDLCIYFPFDFLPAVRRILNLVRPTVVVIMETEIWPNFTREAHRRKIPVILANGRISDRSFSGYLRFSWFFRHALQLFSRLCMQTSVDSQRITAVGAPAEKVITIGNLKYDIPFRQISADESRQLRGQYGIPQDLTVITAASTHAGEEQHLISCYRELFKSNNSLFLVLVPRHPERSAEVAALLERSGIPFRRRTELSKTELFQPGSVLLVDTIGEMMNLYALSDIAFVGGSLVPTGGHNLLEPASVGVPCLFGPHMSNFREIAALVLKYGAGLQVETPQELTDACQNLITNSARRRLHGRNGLKMMADNGGATGRHMDIISAYL